MSALTPIVPQLTNRGRGWDWDAHQRHGKIGGEDYEVKSGTFLTAPVSGRATKLGNTVTITMPDGRSVTLRHVYPEGKFPRKVVIGNRIAVSGADGGLWPHFEAKVDGQRKPFTSLVSAYRRAKASSVKMLSSRLHTVRLVAAYVNAHTSGLNSAAEHNGKPGPVYWTNIQRLGKARGLYGKGYIVNGVPGPRTRFVERYFAALAR